MEEGLRQVMAMSSGLGPDAYPGVGTLFLATYDYVESGVTQRCGFLCHATSVQDAAESFWNQHPGEWFHLISVSDGSIEFFWVAKQGTFVTVPGKEL